MKRFLLTVIASALVLTLVSCVAGENENSGDVTVTDEVTASASPTDTVNGTTETPVPVNETAESGTDGFGIETDDPGIGWGELHTVG